MARLSSIAWALACCMPLLASSPPLVAQEPQHLNVSLSRPNRTIGTLPFDEPIRVIGVVPAYIRRVDPLRTAVRGPGSGSCATLEPVLQSAGQSWVRSAPPPRDSAAADTFDLVLNPLRPDRNYLLCLRSSGQIPDTMLARIQREVTAKVDSIMHAARPVDGRYPELTGEQATAILDGFKNALPRLAPHQKWDFSKAPIFDESADDTTRIKTLVRIREPLHDRAAAIRNLTRTGQQLRDSLARLGNDHELTLRQILGSVGATDTVAGWPVASAPGMLSAVRVLLRTTGPRPDALAPEALQRIALGLSSASDTALVTPDKPVTLDSLWTAEQGAAYLARVHATRQSLEGLRSLASAIEFSEAAQRRTGIDQRRAGALRRALDGLSRTLSDLGRDARAFHESSIARDRGILAAVKTLSAASEEEVPVLTSTVAVDLNTRAKRYISPDLGVAYAPVLGEAVPYFGVTFLPLGYNRNVVQRGLEPVHSSFGLMLGLSVTSLAKADERKDLFGGSNLLFGGTVRFFDVFRASAGGIALRQLNPETLAADAPVRVTYFGALSFDLDVKALFGGISTILGGGK
jgi:hypothetical protein